MEARPHQAHAYFLEYITARIADDIISAGHDAGVLRAPVPAVVVISTTAPLFATSRHDNAILTVLRQ